MKISNEEDSSGAWGQYGELLRIQADFQARLAHETLRYLRRIQGMFEPRVPGTVVRSAGGDALGGAGRPGGAVELSFEAENRQRVHCVVTPSLTPMLGAGGSTWFPALEASPPTSLVAPGEEVTFVLRLPLPEDLPPGAYRGTLLLQGFQQEGLPVEVEVLAGEQSAASIEHSAASSEHSAGGGDPAEHTGAGS